MTIDSLEEICTLTGMLKINQRKSKELAADLERIKVRIADLKEENTLLNQQLREHAKIFLDTP